MKDYLRVCAVLDSYSPTVLRAYRVATRLEQYRHYGYLQYLYPCVQILLISDYIFVLRYNVTVYLFFFHCYGNTNAFLAHYLAILAYIL